MALDPNIVLKAKVPNVNRLANNIEDIRPQQQRNRLFEESLKARQLQNQSLEGQISQAEQNRQITDAAMDSIELKKILEASPDQAIPFLEKRVERIRGRNGDPQHSLGAIEQIRSGDIKGLTAELDGIIEVAKQRKLIRDEANINKFGRNLIPVIGPDGKQQFAQVSGDGGVRIVEGITPIDKVDIETRIQSETPQGQAKTEKAQADAALAKSKAEEFTKKQNKSDKMLIEQANFIEDQIKIALKQADAAPDGRLGEIMARVSPTGNSAALRRTLETIKANVGFGELIRMKQSSPTGGALGSVSERELTLLTATLGNLDAIQGDEELGRVLNQIRDVFKRIRTDAGGSEESSAQTGSFTSKSGINFTVE